MIILGLGNPAKDAEMSNRRPVDSPESFGGARSAGYRTSPSAGNGGSSVREEAIWKRLKEAGFDEETIKRRDKAALISYVTRLETQIYDYQCNMGLILLEKKDLESKYNELQISSESAEVIFKRDKAVNLSALGEARKREENLKKALGIEKECLANIEKTLHEMRVESAEIKVAYEKKLVEAQSMMETAQRMLEEANSKACEAAASQAEASRRQNTAMRTLQDIEAREGEVRRRIASFQSECETREKDISLHRQSLNDSQQVLRQEQERLMEAQILLGQREERLHEKLKKLALSEKELAEAKLKFEEDSSTLRDEKVNLELDVSALVAREESVIKREAFLDKKDRELLILQEKISNKEIDDIQRLKAEYQHSFERKTLEFEAETEQRRISLENEMEVKRKDCDVLEAAFKKREEQIMKMENAVSAELQAISEKQKDAIEKFHLLEEKEKALLLAEKTLQSNLMNLQTEKKEIDNMKKELHKDKASLEHEKTEILHAVEKLAITSNERNELLVFEKKLKEEIDSFRARKLELEVETNNLRSEREKFESNWDLIDEKKKELRNEADRIAEERRAVAMYLRNELDRLNAEKESLHNQLKQNAETLSFERDDFIRKMEREQSDWFTKFHKEKEGFLNNVKLQREELVTSICSQREEVENYLRGKEEAFRQEKINELQIIASQKEDIAKQMNVAVSNLKRLDDERMEIAREREQNQVERSDINCSIEVLNTQREKLQKQRELLRADREEIDKKIQLLMRLEHSNIESESRTRNYSNANDSVMNIGMKGLRYREAGKNDKYLDYLKMSLADGTKELFFENASNCPSPPSAHKTWLKKWAELIFKPYLKRIADSTCRQDCRQTSSKEEKSRPPMESNMISTTDEKYNSNGSENMMMVRRKRQYSVASNDYSSFKGDRNNKYLKKPRKDSVVDLQADLDNCAYADYGMLLEDNVAAPVARQIAVEVEHNSEDIIEVSGDGFFNT